MKQTQSESFVRALEKRTLIAALIALAVAGLSTFALLGIQSYQEEARVSERIQSFLNGSEKSLASQLIIYEIYNLPVDNAFKLGVQAFHPGLIFSVRNKTGLCLLGECDALKSPEPNEYISLRRDLVLSGEQVGKVEVHFPKVRSSFGAVKFPLIMLLISFVVFWITQQYLIVGFIRRRALTPIHQLLSAFQKLEAGNRDVMIPESGLPGTLKEFQVLFQGFNSMVDEQNKATEREKRRAASEEIGRVAAQVSHDIRSPLAALSVLTSKLGGIQQVAEMDRVLLKTAMDRIREVANSLLSRYECQLSASDTSMEVEFVPLLLEKLVDMKSLEFRSREDLVILLEIQEGSLSVFSKVEKSAFSRVLSNLINNAAEAIEGPGTIRILMQTRAEKVEISVSDSGKGIPDDVLPHLMTDGFSFGKKTGTGMGLFHARTTVESWGGEIQIASKLSAGTKVTIAVPKAEAPEWSTSRIIIKKGSKVVILDDDSSIHEIWKNRFNGLLALHALNLIHFHSGVELMSWYLEQDEAQELLFLVDYELVGQRLNGVELIEKMGIHEHSYLITSQVDHPELRKKCASLNMKLVPKSICSQITISVV